MPELSVISPVWGEDYLGWLPEFLDSVLAQRDDVDLEVLIVDNANEPPLVIEREGVRVIRIDNRVSVGEARNIAIAASDAPFVASGDVDDVFPAGYFARRLKIMNGPRKPVAISTRPNRWFEEENRVVPAPYPQEHVFWLYRFRRIFGVSAMLGRSTFIMNSSVLRRQAVLRAGGYSPLNSEEDTQLSLLLPFLGKIEILRDGGVWKRQHSDSLAKQSRLQSIEERKHSYAIALKRCTSEPAPWYVRWVIKPVITAHYKRRLDRYRSDIT